MTKLATIFLACSLAAQPASAFEYDKALHALAGVAIAQTTGHVAEQNDKDRWKWGCGAAVVAGALKEAYDSTGRGDVEAADFLATAVAGCLSLTIRW